MKKAGAFVASIAAASSIAPPNSSDAVSRFLCASIFHQEVRSSSSSSESQSPEPGSGVAAPDDKFAPRFDGLRFIETLVTAHR